MIGLLAMSTSTIRSRCTLFAAMTMAIVSVAAGFATMQQRPPGLAQPVWHHPSKGTAPGAANGALAPLLLTSSRSLFTKRTPSLPPLPPGFRKGGALRTRVGAGARQLTVSMSKADESLAALGITRPQALILASMMSYALIALYVGVGDLLRDGIIISLSNAQIAILCFGGADLLTQGYESVRTNYKTRIDVQRVFAACMVGIVCNTVGLPVWLYFLDHIIPKAVIGLQGLAPFGKLVLKAFTHSLVWGTISNSISLVLRRLMTGDTLRGSVDFWHDKILTVTSKQIFFWPTFMCFNFAVVPAPFQIQATALGAFVFNVFISFIASAPPRPVEQETFDLIKTAMTIDAVEPRTFELVEAAMSAPAVPEDRLEEELRVLLRTAPSAQSPGPDEKELLKTALAAPVVEAEDVELIKVAMNTAAVSEETFEVVTQALAEHAETSQEMEDLMDSFESDLEDGLPADEAEAAGELIKAALAAPAVVSESAPTDTIVIT